MDRGISCIEVVIDKQINRKSLSTKVLDTSTSYIISTTSMCYIIYEEPPKIMLQPSSKLPPTRKNTCGLWKWKNE